MCQVCVCGPLRSLQWCFSVGCKVKVCPVESQCGAVSTKFIKWHSSVGLFQLSFSSGVPVYPASIRSAAQPYPSVHWVNQWHSNGIPVYTGPTSVHWLRVRKVYPVGNEPRPDQPSGCLSLAPVKHSILDCNLNFFLIFMDISWYQDGILFSVWVLQRNNFLRKWCTILLFCII